LPYLITTTYYTISMQHQLFQELSIGLVTDSNLMLKSIQGLFSETQRVAYLPLLNQNITRILQTNHEHYDLAYYTDELTMLNAIKHATNLNTNMLAVTFYSRYGNMYQVNHLPTSQVTQQAQWLKNSQDASERLYVAPIQVGSLQGQSRSILPVIYALYNSLGSEFLGFVQIDYDLGTLLESAINQSSGNTRFAILQDDTMLLDTGGLYGVLSPQLQNKDSSAWQQGVWEQDASGAKMALYHQSETLSRLSILAYRPVSFTSQPVMRNIRIYLVVLAVLLMIGLWFSFRISRNMGNAIKELSYAMDNAQHGQTELLPDSHNILVQSELDLLKNSYNSMIHRLQSSAKREYEAQVQQKNIAMRVLESQLNPHFLYNSLNLIASLAQLSHQDTIRSVSISLATMLRYSIKGGSIVPLEEELTQTGHYINIMKLRFPDRIIINTQIDSTLLDCKVPKLLLQPLLENACKYATDTTALMAILGISAQAEGNDLCLTVSDNGPGIPPEKLCEIQEKMAQYGVGEASFDSQAGSIGLINVHARVRAHFGLSYGVEISSTPQGCGVTVRLPQIREISPYKTS